MPAGHQSQAGDSAAIKHAIEGRDRRMLSRCGYPDGMKVLCCALCELKAGKIARPTVVQAWDE